MMELLKKTLSEIAPANESVREQVKRRIDTLTMPPWALGRLLDLAVDLGGITGDPALPVTRKTVVVMAGDHGIASEGVCPQPSEVTLQMVRNISSGGAGVNVLAGLAGARVVTVDLGVAGNLDDLVKSGAVLDRRVAPGTANFAHGPAMTREQAVTAVERGIELALELSASTDVFGTGEMGIGNTSPSSAIVTVLSGETDPTPYVGRGAGLPPEKLAHKIAVIRRGIECNRPDPADGLDVLGKVGGFEIGGIAGLILGAAARRRPVIVDGFISTAGALIAASLCPAARDSMILAHGSAEPGHVRMAALLGKKPLLELGMRLGEGTGAALAFHLTDAASAIVNRMATFASAGVSTAGR